jgi:allantoin racemase
MTVGIIRVLTTNDRSVLEEHARLLRAAYGLECITRCIPDQPHGIYDDVTEEQAVPKIVALGQALHREGCTSLILSCAGDPGIQALRKAVPIPVVGAGSATARAAAILGLPFAVLGITDSPPRPFTEILGATVPYGRPAAVNRTTDLMTPAGREAALESARALYEQGARVIAFSCTGYSTIGLAEDIRKKLGGAVVDAVLAAGMVTAALA